jgi:eukaryotic-like serine/threonine-protein kinase
MAELETGARVASHYVVVSLLGQGGMGTVYRARDERDDSLVAIKVLREARGDLATRFIREARIASALSHPNIATVKEVLELDDGAPAMVMELLHGESLGARIARSGKMDGGTIARVFRPVVAAIKAAHERGVVHRDLKPDNIFLCDDGTVKVLDFGIARVIFDAADPAITAEALTDTGQLLGTPQYMAPEQIFGEKDVDARADVWALGVILYQALAGVRPFDGANPGQVFKAIALDPPVPLDERVPNAPRALADLVSRMLVHARAERLSDLAEVERVLDRLASSSDLGEAPTLMAESVPSPRRSNRTVAIVAGTFATIGAIAAVAASRSPSASSPPSPSAAAAPSAIPLAVSEAVPAPSSSAPPPLAPPAESVTVTVANIPPSPKTSSANVRSASPSLAPVASVSSAAPDAGARTNRSGPLKRDEF